MTRVLSRIPQSVYVLAVVAGLLTWQLAPRAPAPLDPEVLDSVHSIVRFCEAAVDITERAVTQQEAARCKDVRYVVQWCSTRGKGLCTLEHLVDTLVALGFRLPPLRPASP
ncbi:MAG TPA: hypothetical protein VKB51_05425 [bacterium]|nr:hypothetical protein [bacterium]